MRYSRQPPNRIFYTEDFRSASVAVSGSGIGSSGFGSQNETVGSRIGLKGPREVIARTISRVALKTSEVPFIVVNLYIFSSFTASATCTKPIISTRKQYGKFRSEDALRAILSVICQSLLSSDFGTAWWVTCKSAILMQNGFCASKA
jgi:hypothetical protein